MQLCSCDRTYRRFAPLVRGPLPAHAAATAAGLPTAATARLNAGAEGAPRAVPLADCRGERLPLRFAPAAADATVATWTAAASAHLDLEWRESAVQPDGCPVAVVSAAPADANAMMLPAALELRRRIVEE